MCTKLRFSSKKAAKLYIKARGRNHGLRARHVYPCHDCPGYWHMTNRTAGRPLSKTPP